MQVRSARAEGSRREQQAIRVFDVPSPVAEGDVCDSPLRGRPIAAFCLRSGGDTEALVPKMGWTGTKGVWVDSAWSCGLDDSFAGVAERLAWR